MQGSGDWLSERVVFGLLIIGGFLALGGASFLVPLSDKQIAAARDVLLVLGPVVGLIGAAIWKSDRAEKHTSEAVSQLASAVNSLSAPPPEPPKPGGG